MRLEVGCLLQAQTGAVAFFTDGSCSTEANPDFRRAGWGLAALSVSGSILFAARGPVPQHVAQSPQVAEHMA